MRFTDAVGVEWEVSRRGLGLWRGWAVEASSERGELAWRLRGGRRARRAVAEVAAAFERGERSFSPDGARRLLPESPFSYDGRGNVRVVRGR